MLRGSCSGRYLAPCLLLLLLTVTGVYADENEQQNAAGLEQLRVYLGSLQDLRAGFRQDVISPEQEIVESASGTVILSKPGRFRWDYREPYERVIVANGERVWFYESDLEQVTIRRLAVGIGDTPAALLTGDEAALEHFVLLDSWLAEGQQWLQLAPVSSEADFSIVDLGFTAGELQQIIFVDRLGQRTRVSLFDIDRSLRLGDADFQFEIPAGVDVIDEKEM
ncbi:MAG TPA: outer membrane lipoprotein chaperone LolA [Gammaproteobacteria bacterium]|nr:outer membrane lipoprotein chaperone LolA [Gammaproteobacteria bacterium]MDP7093601.1 outer membrane lipoprotein chaperone LolA [Gammaproteobacteria bacterium]MDP7296649.1 outer membrane lipoprotein chaperone LolA [Gammaproteobacteria bacterium]MDP7660273.1 outer membrane lipoprotein chaperone LolA [Gammaproteobacteria bacterium]HJP39194.1 outer membrane lipoprotein chaperone LolA [Gammaproteobacteria bacterium]